MKIVMTSEMKHGDDSMIMIILSDDGDELFTIETTVMPHGGVNDNNDDDQYILKVKINVKWHETLFHEHQSN